MWYVVLVAICVLELHTQLLRDLYILPRYYPHHLIRVRVGSFGGWTRQRSLARESRGGVSPGWGSTPGITTASPPTRWPRVSPTPGITIYKPAPGEVIT